MKRIALFALALVAAASAASAEPYDSTYWHERRIDAREARQADRIYDARRRGELTWYEAFRLRQEQARIRRMENAALADGHVSPYEARHIERAQDRANHHIYDQAHDGQRAWWRRW
jgi:hypothetical protein